MMDQASKNPVDRQWLYELSDEQVTWLKRMVHFARIRQILLDTKPNEAALSLMSKQLERK